MKKNIILNVIFVLSVLGLGGCSADTTSSNTRGNMDGTKNGSYGTPNSNSNSMNSNSMNMNMSNMNKDTSNTNSNSAGMSSSFMTEAAQGGMAEVELGKLAASKGQNAEVKAFGQKMVADHSKANAELKDLATKKNVTLPTDVNSTQKADMEKLKGLSGAEFDKEYVALMVEDHEKDVKAFQTQADGATDADVKAFAAKTLPTLKMHLDMINKINGKMK